MIRGRYTFTAEDALASSQIPETDNAYDLGSATKEWKDLYVDGVAYTDKIEIGSSVPTASSLAIQDNSLSGDAVYIRSEPAGDSTLNLLTLHADHATNFVSGSNLLYIITEDNHANPIRVFNGTDTVFNVNRQGNIVCSGGISTSSNANLTLVPNGSGITIVGDAGTTSHSLNTNDDLFVSGRLEVNGNLFADGHFFPPTVTYTTNMNADVAGTASEIVYCSTDSKAYVCTTTGAAGSAVWAALN